MWGVLLVWPGFAFSDAVAVFPFGFASAMACQDEVPRPFAAWERRMVEAALAGGEQLRLLDQQRLDGLRNAIESARASMRAIKGLSGVMA